MTQAPGLYILHTDEKGRGVYTSKDLDQGDLIEICPILKIPKDQISIIHKTVIHDYYFLWGEEECVLALGYGSLYNHAVHSNAEITLDYENETIDFIAIKPIKAGEEITINYFGESGKHGEIWW